MDQKTVMFGNMENDEFVELDDPNLIKNLMALFTKESKDILDKIINLDNN